MFDVAENRSSAPPIGRALPALDRPASRAANSLTPDIVAILAPVGLGTVIAAAAAAISGTIIATIPRGVVTSAVAPAISAAAGDGRRITARVEMHSGTRMGASIGAAGMMPMSLRAGDVEHRADRQQHKS